MLQFSLKPYQKVRIAISMPDGGLREYSAVFWKKDYFRRHMPVPICLSAKKLAAKTAMLSGINAKGWQ